MFSGNSGIPVTMNVEPAGSGYNNNGGFGGFGDGWWAIIIFAMIFGWGNGGWGGGFGGGNGVQGALTRGDLCQDMNFSDLESAVRGVQQGLCDGFYAVNTSLLNSFHGVDNAVCTLGYQTQQGFNGVDNAICNLGYNVQQGFNATNVAMLQGQNAIQSQLADCCCENRQAIAQVRYDMATQACDTRNTIQNTTRDIIDNNNANTRSILDFLVQDKISTLQAENQSLKLAASQADQNAFIAANQSAQTAELIRRLGADCPQPAYVVQPPQPVTFPTNCCGGVNYAGYGNNGCGCGNNGCC